MRILDLYDEQIKFTALTDNSIIFFNSSIRWRNSFKTTWISGAQIIQIAMEFFLNLPSMISFSNQKTDHLSTVDYFRTLLSLTLSQFNNF
jgi:hypothetical protein